MPDTPPVHDDPRGRPVVWDQYSNEPVAWAAVGEPVAGVTYLPSGTRVAYTSWLSVSDAIGKYGPIEEWITGPGGGFRKAVFGTTVLADFDSNGFDPKSLPAGILTVDDDDMEWPCPRCQAAPGQRCEGTATKHRVRRAHGEQYEKMRHELAHLRATIDQLREENERLDERLDKYRRKPDPICARPRRDGQPCQANAILYPVAIESCKVHLTDDEKKALGL